MSSDDLKDLGKASGGGEESGTKRVRLLPSHVRRFFQGPWDLMVVATVGLFVLGSIGFLYFARPFLLPVVLALFLNFLFKPVVRKLNALRVPYWLGSIFVVLVFVFLMVVGMGLIAQPAVEWVERAPESIRAMETKFAGFLKSAEQLSRLAEHVENITRSQQGDPMQQVEVKSSNLAEAMVGHAAGFFAAALETVVLLYFLLAYSDLFLRKLTNMVAEETDQRQVMDIAHEVQMSVSSYLVTITIINSCLGIFVGLALWIVDMPNPALWGVLAAFLNFIPYFGPLMGVIVLSLAGLLTFEGAGAALAPAIIYLSMHTVEANFITPTVLGRRLTLNPVVIFTALIFWMWLWGIPGALLAVPLLMMTKILCDHIRPLRALGQFLSG